MNARTICRPTLVDLARDPMVRLMMASDGVTEAELVGVWTVAQRAVAARAVPRVAATRPEDGRAQDFDVYRCSGLRSVR